MAATLWLHGYSVQICVSPGQDGRSGQYSMKNGLSSARLYLRSAVDDLNPPLVVFVGSCAGGVIAGHLSAETNRASLLVLWETPLLLSTEHHQKYVQRASEIGIPVADDYFSSTLDLDDVASQIKGPVLVGYGNATSTPIFPPCEYESMRQGLPNAHVEECFIDGARHSLLRGHSPTLLKMFVERLLGFIGRHSSRQSCFNKANRT